MSFPYFKLYVMMRVLERGFRYPGQTGLQSLFT